jgi:GPH family glycoside/pentoside/hexuronide:cation symporter
MSRVKKYNTPWRYALAMFGLSIMGYMYTTYGTFFYTDKIGLSMAAIGIGNILFAVWDAFNDPICGYLSDRTRTRWGRRRPWLIVSVPVMTIAAILFFNPPAALGTGLALAVYFTVFLLLTESANSVATVNYHSLLPELFRETKRRNSANSLRQALQLVGMIIGVSLVPLLAQATGYQATALLLGVLGGALVIYSVLGTREDKGFADIKPPRLKDSLKALIGNSNFWFVSVSHFLYQATTGLLLAGIPFYIKYHLEEADGMAAILSASVFVTALPSMFLWYKLINKYGTLKIWRLALLTLGLSLVPLFFSNALWFAAVAGTLVGIGIAGVTANLDMINSELIEEDARRYGVRREATYFAGISFVTRLSGLIRSGVFLLLVYIFGFESSAVPGDRPGVAARFMMIVFPVILMALSFSVSLLVKFKKKEC